MKGGRRACLGSHGVCSTQLQAVNGPPSFRAGSCLLQRQLGAALPPPPLAVVLLASAYCRQPSRVLLLVLLLLLLVRLLSCACSPAGT